MSFKGSGERGSGSVTADGQEADLWTSAPTQTFPKATVMSMSAKLGPFPDPAPEGPRLHSRHTVSHAAKTGDTLLCASQAHMSSTQDSVQGRGHNHQQQRLPAGPATQRSPFLNWRREGRGRPQQRQAAGAPSGGSPRSRSIGFPDGDISGSRWHGLG